MNVAGWVWVATLLGLTALFVVDLAVVGRRPHEPSVRESTAWIGVYVALAVLFGIGIWLASGVDYAGQFAAGWFTEYSLSVDNLFVFMIIMSRFAVPRLYHQRVLFVGILLALAMRGVFITAGAALIHQFAFVFYIFGAFLLYTAWRLARHGVSSESDYTESILVRWSRRVLPMTNSYDSSRVVTRRGGRLVFTPLMVVMIAIGTTDVVFALDSIPAIFGLTTEAYLVFTANVFALMGLRQLYFLLGDLLRRLTYLSAGLSVVLGFIGIKLLLQALHANNLPFINGGQPLTAVPTVPIWLSLAIIFGTLGTATACSLQRREAGHRGGAGQSGGAGPNGRAERNGRVPMRRVDADAHH
jgi:TerC family integral membrane protein